MPNRPPPKRHLSHCGFSIPAAAHELGVPEGTIRRAVKLGQIEIVEFAGLPRIPPREIDRIRAALGIEPGEQKTA